ncbi:acyltransferase family protein [uncultured Alistipes sp.]|uniref:acyltransferase family protein n=1 Tax=uncultured Alistipes sp. TaxID=538949 RepID=UPI0026186A58|nr:acyltransferase family protein [uncultured Alistipes sp.]
MGHWLAVGCFVSATPFWFVRTYLCLYLLAPVINRFLHRIAPKERIALLAALAFVSHYVGSVGCDPSLAGGKNLATFLFLYAAGDTLRACRSSWLPYRRTCGLIWILLNAGLVVLFTCWTSPVGRAVFSRMWFSYCSFGLLASALLFFVWIGGLRFSSPLVNRVARSSLAIYLLHGAPLVALHVIAPFVVRYVCPLGGRGAVLGALLPLTLGIIAACVATDNLLAPLWRALDRLGSRLGARWERLGCTYFSR